MNNKDYAPSIWTGFWIFITGSIFFASFIYALRSFFDVDVNSDESYGQILFSVCVLILLFGVTQGYRSNIRTKIITLFAFFASFLVLLIN